MAETAEQQKQQQSPEEAAAEAQVKARQDARRRRDEQQEGDGESMSGHQAVRAAAQGKDLKEDEIHDALEFFLAEDGEEPQLEPKELKLNLGTTQKPQFIRWTIIPVDDAEIVKIRKQSQRGTKVQKRRGEAEVDENAVARKIVVRATIDPDIGDLSKKLDLIDPADAVLAYFRRFGKTGLILQISGEILNISGYDEDDVSEIDAALG